jgi:hypothetical protein
LVDSLARFARGLADAATQAGLPVQRPSQRRTTTRRGSVKARV